MASHWLIFAVLIARGTATEFREKSFLPVSNIFPKVNEWKCSLGVEVLKTKSKFLCLSRCMIKSDCFLSCFDGETCKFYRSKVSTYWNSSKYPNDKSDTLTNFKCFTSYYFESDITDKIIGIKGVEDNPKFNKEKAFDGYICLGTPHLYGSGKNSKKAWLEVEFDSSYPIRMVAVQVRSTYGERTGFEEVVFRVGDLPGVNGSFSMQASFGYQKEEAQTGELIVISRTPPLRGKYLSIQKQVYGDLVIEDAKVFV